MDDIRKTKAQLTAELNDLRKQAEHEREFLLAQVTAAREEAANAKDRLNGILERVGDGFVAFDANFNYTYVNTRGGELLGRKADDLIGKNYWSEYPEARGTPFANAYVRAMTTQQPVMLEDYYVHWDRWFENRIYPSREGITIFFTDVTERKQAEGALHRLNRELRALSDCNQILIRAEDEQTLLNDICHIICDEAGYRMAWVGYADHDVARTVRPVAWAGTEDGYLAAINVTWADSERGRGPTGTAIRSGQSVYVQDFVTDPRTGLWREDALQRGYRSSLALPLKDESTNLFGALTIFSTEPNAFIPDEIRLLEELAGDLAYGITALRARVERQRAEQALQESEERFHSLFEKHGAIMFLIDPDSGQILDANAAAQALYGYPGGVLKRMAIQDIATAPAEEVAARRVQSLEQPLNYFVAQHRLASGEVRTVEVRSTPIAIGGKPILFSIIHDITERQRAESQREAALEALRKSEAKFRAVVENSNDGILFADANAKILYRSPSYNHINGFSDEERIGHSGFETVHPDDFEAVRQIWKQGLQQSEPIHKAEYRIRHKDGRWRWIDTTLQNLLDNPNVQAMVVTSHDVTERKQAESQREAALEALRASETKFRTMFMVSSDGIYITQADGDIIVEANDAFANIFGYVRDEIIGRTSQQLNIFYDISDREKLVRDGRAYGFIKDVEVKGKKKNGEIMMCSLSAQVIILDNGTYYLGVVRDITERKRAEEQLRHTQKLESLGVLAGGVAHDFNNLLAALLGQTSLASAKLPSDHPAQHHLDRAVAAARRAADLTRQMLAYSGRGAFQMMPLNLNTLIRDNTGFLESSISKSIALRTDLAEFPPLINADSGQMQQIVMNLVLNAAEAIGERAGTVSLATSVIDITDDDKHWAHYTGQAVAAGRYVQLRVEDSGHGMSAKTLSHIFDPFFTTKFTGRGLGLAAVLGIVRGHRGGLWVESKVGQGTTFTVIFPITAETEAAPTTIVQKMPTQQIVLVIDDEEPVLEAIADMLELDSISALCVRTGAEGIALFRERHTDIGLVLLDLSMPGLSGRETFEQLLQIDPQARIVLSSGYTQAEATRDFEGRKLAGFLHKPYDMDTLLDMVRQHLQRKAGE